MRIKTIGIAVGLVAFAAVARLYATHRAWQELLATGEKFEDLLEERNTERPVLHGEPIEGLAFDEYNLALELLSPTVTDDWQAHQQAKLHGIGSRIEVRDRMLEDNLEALAALERGARSTDARFNLQWKSDFELQLPTLMSTRQLANLCTFAAERHLEQGQPQLAVDVLLDGMQLARDFMESPVLINEMVGVSLLAIVSNEALLDDGLLQCIPSQHLERLAAGMRTVDATLSRISPSWDGELVCYTQMARNLECSQAFTACQFFGPHAAEDWFSSRSAVSELVCEAKSLRDCMHALEDSSVVERQEVLRVIAEEWRDECSSRGTNPSIWMSVESSRAQSITLLRLTTMAVEYAATGKVTTLPDPFGTELIVREDNELLRLESVGLGDERMRNRLKLELALSGS